MKALRLRLGFALALSAFAGTACAQTPPPPGAEPALKQLPLHPERFLGRRVDGDQGYCFADGETFVCIGADQPFEVVAPRLAPASLIAYLKDNCGGMDAIERNPFPQCAARFSFVVARAEAIRGDYMLHGHLQSQARMTRLHADALTISRR